jgi:hypothetical protein
MPIFAKVYATGCTIPSLNHERKESYRALLARSSIT